MRDEERTRETKDREFRPVATKLKFQDMRINKILNYLTGHISATRQQILEALGLEELK